MAVRANALATIAHLPDYTQLSSVNVRPFCRLRGLSRSQAEAVFEDGGRLGQGRLGEPQRCAQRLERQDVPVPCVVASPVLASPDRPMSPVAQALLLLEGGVRRGHFGRTTYPACQVATDSAAGPSML